MKQNFYLLAFMLLWLGVSLTSCQLAGDVFKGGIWTGLIIAIVVVALIIYVITRMGKKS